MLYDATIPQLTLLPLSPLFRTSQKVRTLSISIFPSHSFLLESPLPISPLPCLFPSPTIFPTFSKSKRTLFYNGEANGNDERLLLCGPRRTH
jgi:hypothetical protein